MSFSSREEESFYMQLMCDVTADLLQRHLCTNGKLPLIILHSNFSKLKYIFRNHERYHFHLCKKIKKEIFCK